ncbi:MAG TPA: DinB family protein [Candidatus Dormibacteraeota bacterium]|nr:DinB family protein [Candidatus Dormibacteraeota bacterium]
MSKPNRAELITRYREGPAVLADAVSRLSERQLDHKPADGGFSAREVVHHTADSEMTSAIRLRRLVAEDNPQITGYDPDLFAARLHYARRPVQPSLDAIRAARESTASILEALSEAEWERAGTHSELGAYSVDKWLEIYAAHCHDHADQARRAAEGAD